MRTRRAAKNQVKIISDSAHYLERDAAGELSSLYLSVQAVQLFCSLLALQPHSVQSPFAHSVALGGSAGAVHRVFPHLLSGLVV